MTPKKQGESAARQWLDGPYGAEEPENPFPRPKNSDEWKKPSDFMWWNVGYNIVCFQEWGMDHEAERVERQAGC